MICHDIPSCLLQVWCFPTMCTKEEVKRPGKKSRSGNWLWHLSSRILKPRSSQVGKKESKLWGTGDSRVQVLMQYYDIISWFYNLLQYCRILPHKAHLISFAKSIVIVCHCHIDKGLTQQPATSAYQADQVLPTTENGMCCPKCP